MKRTLMLFAAVVVMLGLAYAHDAVAEEQPIAQAVVSVHRGDLNGRMQPTIHSAIEAYFANGELISIYEVQGNWARTAGGEAGFCWVHINYLVTEDHGFYSVTANGRLRLRSTPDGDVTGWLQPDQVVEVFGIFGDWARTERGWVMAAYLQRSE